MIRLRPVAGLAVALSILAGCGSARPFTGVPPSGNATAARAPGPAAAAVPIVLKFSHVTAASTPKGRAAEAFAAKVKENFQGRVRIEVYPDSTLFNDANEIEALMSGKVDLLAPAAGKLPSAEWQMFDVPFVLDVDRLEYDLNGKVGEILAASVEPMGYKALGVWSAGNRHFTNDVRPLRAPADFANLRFRIQKSPILAGTFEQLRATAVPMPFDQVYAAMEKKSVDGGENSLANIYTQNMHKVQKHLTLSGHAMLIYPVVVNLERWEKLPADVRNGLEEIIREVSVVNRASVSAEETRFLEKIKTEANVTVHTLSPDERNELRKALAPVHEKWLNQVDKRLASALR